MNGRKHKWNSRRRRRAIFGFRQSKLCLNQKTDSREFIKARRSSRFGRWNCKPGRSGEEILRWQSQALTDSARARVKRRLIVREWQGRSGRREMAISQELLDILVCPLDKTPVKLTSDKKGLKCSQCRRVYPIRDDIPVMLVDEAKIEAQ